MPAVSVLSRQLCRCRHSARPPCARHRIPGSISTIAWRHVGRICDGTAAWPSQSRSAGQCRAVGGQQKLADSKAEATKPAAYLAWMRIQDFALVSNQTFRLQPGLNVISGESGSGKSVLLAAFSQVLGMQASDDLIRAPSKTAVVEAIFYLGPIASRTIGSLLRDLGLPSSAVPHHEGGKIHIRREISYVTSEHSPPPRAPKGAASAASPASKPAIRSKCFVNGAATQLKILKQLGAALVDVNGQNASAALRSSDTQLALLDRIAGTGLKVKEFSDKVARLAEIEASLAEMDGMDDEAQREEDKAYVDEILALKLQPGEELTLREQIRHLDSRVSCVQQCGVAHRTIGNRGDEGSLTALLASVDAHMRFVREKEANFVEAMSHGPVAQPDDSGEDAHDASVRAALEGVSMMEEVQSLLGQAGEYLEEAKARLEEYMETFEFDKQHFARLKARQEAITRLLRECGCRSVAELLAEAKSTQAALEQWAEMSVKLPALREERGAIQARLAQLAVEVSEQRRVASGKLRHAVETCLKQLAMPHSRFDVRIAWDLDTSSDAGGTAGPVRSLHIDADSAAMLGEDGDRRYKLQARGLDRVEFLLAAGPAEPLRPLRAVASGGESSRIMLALKTAPALTSSLPCLSTLDELTEDLGGGDSRGKDSEGVITVEAPDGTRQLFPMSGAAVFDSDTAGWDEQLAALGTPIMVLDEIDAGVGARLGTAMGEVLHSMARDGQILCVSHVAQVAAHADFHLKVEKHMSEGRPETRFSQLRTLEERVAEIRAMIGLEDQQGADTARRLLHDAALATGSIPTMTDTTPESHGRADRGSHEPLSEGRHGAADSIDGTGALQLDNVVDGAASDARIRTEDGGQSADSIGESQVQSDTSAAAMPEPAFYVESLAAHVEGSEDDALARWSAGDGIAEVIDTPGEAASPSMHPHDQGRDVPHATRLPNLVASSHASPEARGAASSGALVQPLR